MFKWRHVIYQKYTYISVLFCIFNRINYVYNESVPKLRQVSKINSYELEIARSIIQSKLVHYADIEKATGKSKKTIARYLDNIESEVNKYGIKLVRKRNVGIYFEGEISKLQKIMEEGGAEDSFNSKKQRAISLLSKLLLTDQPQKIQDLADAEFVSRSTFENDLKQVKSILKDSGASLKSRCDGIIIDATERVRRRLMSQLLDMYWGQATYYNGQGKDGQIRMVIPKDMEKFFNIQTLNLVMQSLDKFKKISAHHLNDYEYQSLAIHLVIAIERIQRNEVLKANEAPDMKLEKDTQLLVAILEDCFHISIPRDEQAYINIHILASDGVPPKRISDMQSEHLHEENSISNFLKELLVHSDKILIRNLTLHLIPALKRLSLGLSIKNPYTADIKKNFPFSYNSAVDLGMDIKKEFGIEMTDNELAFIALHLESYIERISQKVKAAIICSTGLGTARLLEQRINKFFSDKIAITRVVSLQELKDDPVSENLVISTINVDIPDVKVLVVPPFLDKSSIENIENAVSEIIENQIDPEPFIDLLDSNLIIINRDTKTKNEAIRLIGSRLVDLGYGHQGLVEAAIKREELASTEIDHVAMPHAPVEYVAEPCIGIYVNPRGISWGKNYVNIVFFLAMNESLKSRIEKIYEYFNSILENKQLLKKLIHCSNNDKIIKLIRGENVDWK